MTLEPNLASDDLDPALVDWPAQELATVELAAEAGIGRAIAELERRRAATGTPAGRQ